MNLIFYTGHFVHFKTLWLWSDLDWVKKMNRLQFLYNSYCVVFGIYTFVNTLVVEDTLVFPMLYNKLRKTLQGKKRMTPVLRNLTSEDTTRVIVAVGTMGSTKNALQRTSCVALCIVKRGRPIRRCRVHTRVRPFHELCSSWMDNCTSVKVWTVQAGTKQLLNWNWFVMERNVVLEW